MKYFFSALVICFLFPGSLLARVPNDPFFTEQWYLEKIQAPAAWDLHTGSHETIVAIIDSGVDLDHADLAGNLWINTGEIAGNGIDDDRNGYVDDVNGWDFVESDNQPTPNEVSGAQADALSHGSLVAGLIGAVTENASGVAGVNWNVQLMALRVLDESGAGSSTDVSEAIEYAVLNGADVINLSFSGTESHDFLRESIQQAYESGVVIVSALGNEGELTNTQPVYPACYRSESEDWVIGVASTDKADQKAGFSNYGSSCTDISAPGVDIFGVHYFNPDIDEITEYAGEWSGTSMSAPLVAGAAALLRSAYPGLSPDNVKVALQLSVDPVSGSADVRNQMGAGRLNLAQALTVAEEMAGSLVAEPLLPTYVKAPSFETVYHIKNGERRAFINAAAYFTHENSFAVIEGVADASLREYALVGLMLPKPGVVLVKIQSDPRVYAIAENTKNVFEPLLRPIASEEIAAEMYGEHWADFVIDIEPTHFSKFGTGTPITSPEPVDTSIMKTRAHLAALAAN